MEALQLWESSDCVGKPTPSLHAQSSQVPDLLFTGDGEAFNVGDASSFVPEILSNRTDN